MDKPVSALEKLRREIYEDIKQEDIDEVSASSRKATVNIHRRMKMGQDPWMYCFSFNDNESNKFAKKYSTSLDSNKNPRKGKFLDMISKRSSVTDEELNHCKAALRREARLNSLPDLSSNPHDLRLLFSTFRKELPKSLNKQEKLYGEVVCNVEHLELCIKNGLEVLKPLSTTIVTTNTTFDSAKAIITRMRNAMQELSTFTNLVEENLGKVFEKFDKYQELDEDMDLDMFEVLAHFLAKFLVPRNLRRRENTSL